MFKAIKEFFTGKPAVVETPEAAPYKVEVEAKVEAVNAQPVEVAVITAAPKKAPAKKQQFDKKPAAKAKSTKPRNPRAKPATAK